MFKKKPPLYPKFLTEAEHFELLISRRSSAGEILYHLNGVGLFTTYYDDYVLEFRRYDREQKLKQLGI